MVRKRSQSKRSSRKKRVSRKKKRVSRKRSSRKKRVSRRRSSRRKQRGGSPRDDHNKKVKLYAKVREANPDAPLAQVKKIAEKLYGACLDNRPTAFGGEAEVVN